MSLDLSIVSESVIGLVGYQAYYELTDGPVFQHVLSKGRRLGLTDAETFAIHLYTRTLVGNACPSERINEALRGGNWKDMKGLAPPVECLRQGLVRLPPFRGWVVRKTDLPPEITTDLSKLRRFTDPGFLSASQSDPGIFAGNTAMVILAKNARAIHEFSQFPMEKEVLFATGSVFSVDRLAKDGDDTILFLTEL